MQINIIKIWSIFRWIFTATFMLTIGGIITLWLCILFGKSISDLPYLKCLFFALVLEVLAVVISMAKFGFKYLPKIEVKGELSETIIFLKKFIREGSTVTIVSNRISWINDDFINEVEKLIKQGTTFKIILPEESRNSDPNIQRIKELIKDNLIITEEEKVPEARFTLINAGRSGAEKLAIAKGVYPYHEITIFDDSSGPQIIGMAKDIIHKSEEIANAKKME
ncbi:hypothetical protein SCV69_01100 [Legionella pneumophila serogroup 1]|uniref:hypothetical protein n=1 Tax=Legionella pneumophila TaxID=446 RepID=UPI000770B052|nr:hypothetical protein [Legionella pneumophila]HAT8873266.1 hypothetical protein [Legionella pneumophila subsp. pneumophila]MCH9159293.1 hypothetical protein [Legionella pneumophila serogroup 1]CZG31749.1 Uncharacterised protein [Legionella pneumophila]CZG32879.1 Uncharacterised protein [Legionella pneumophila]HAT8949414.1 hypothetical protein [Legionella pneumophila subsp. pneumophila]